MKYKISFIIFSLLIVLFFPKKAVAAETTIGVSPAIVEIVVSPGGESHAVINVFNPTEDYLPIKSSVGEFLLNEGSVSKGFDSKSSLIGVNVSPSNFFLEPNQSKSIQVDIKASEVAEPGGHYLSLYFQRLVESNLQNLNNNVAGRVGVLFFITVRGEIIEKLKVERIDVSRFVFKKSQIPFNVSFLNNGNVHLLVSPEIEIKNLLTKSSYKEKFSPFIMLPNTQRGEKFVYENSLPIGLYRATVRVGYGSADYKTLSSVAFLIFPWLDILIGAGILTFLFFLLKKRKNIVLVFKILFDK